MIFLVIISVITIYILNRKSHYPNIEIYENDLDITYGSENAELKIYLFSNYNCSYCRKFFNDVFPLLEKNYIDNNKVKLIVKLINFTNEEKITTSLKLAVCVNKYGNFEKLNELLITEPKVIYSEEFGKVIDELIMKDEFIAECMLGGESEKYIIQNYALFKANGFTGTPTFIINNNVYKGFRDYKNFVEIIEKEL